MSAEPKISVVIPSYNQGRYLGENLESIFAQNYSNCEIVVIDGGSTDSTLGVLEANSSRLAYWVSEPDRGQAHAINKGLDKVTGDIVAWINSDDLYLPGAFARVAELFDRSKETAVVHGNRVLVDERSTVVGWAAPKAFDPYKTSFNVCSETAFWRSDAFPGIRLREEYRFAMDAELFSRMHLTGKRFLKTEYFLGAFRCHEKAKSSTIWEVGRAEYAKLWAQRYGVQPTVDSETTLEWLLHKLILLRHPFIIGLPYARYRLRRLSTLRR